MEEEENEETHYNLLVSFFAGGKAYLYDITKAKLVKILPTEELNDMMSSFVCDYSKKVHFVFVNAKLAEEDKEKFRKVNAEPENLEELLNESFERFKEFTPLSYSSFMKSCQLIEEIIVLSLLKTYTKLELQELRKRLE